MVVLVAGLRILRQQYIGILALILAVGGTASAATGDFLKLGFLNQADKATVVQNTGNGPALRLKVSTGQVPFTVNSGKLVKRLNAAKLRGIGPNAFAPAQGSPNYAATDSVYTKQESDAKYAEVGASYTTAESDARYLLTTGASLLFSKWESGITAEKIVDNVKFTAPAAGNVIATLNGECINIGATGGTVTLTATVGGDSTSTTTGDGITGSESAGCSVTQSTHVDAGDKVGVTAGWTKTNNGATLFGPALIGTVLVTFQPD